MSRQMQTVGTWSKGRQPTRNGNAPTVDVPVTLLIEQGMHKVCWLEGCGISYECTCFCFCGLLVLIESNLG
eukprot:scaffold421_cov382-Prasinococcus_capsulatus_cf.AAC.5